MIEGLYEVTPNDRETETTSNQIVTALNENLSILRKGT